MGEWVEVEVGERASGMGAKEWRRGRVRGECGVERESRVEGRGSRVEASRGEGRRGEEPREGGRMCMGERRVCGSIAGITSVRMAGSTLPTTAMAATAMVVLAALPHGLCIITVTHSA